MKALIKNLQDKHDAFIGNRKDEITSANAEGFKQGLAWAIETAETMIRITQAEEEYEQQQKTSFKLNIYNHENT